MRPFIGSTLVGIVALLLALFEWDAGRGAKSGVAIVVDTTVAYRTRQTIAGVRHIVIFAMLATWKVLTFAARRRRQAIPLPREPITELLMSARDVPFLPIDTAPPLWDRELDG